VRRAEARGARSASARRRRSGGRHHSSERARRLRRDGADVVFAIAPRHAVLGSEDSAETTPSAKASSVAARNPVR